MSSLRFLKSVLAGGACAVLMAGAARAEQFDIPAGDLASALDAYTAQTGVSLMVSSEAVRGSHTRGAKGELSASAALSQILSGTGFSERREANGFAIVRDVARPRAETVTATHLADAEPTHAAASVETVVVTSSKIKGDIQTVPIAITALSQEQLTSRQIAGGPDLVKEVPNLTFSKTNFSGYTIQIRGIGTQAISVTTDPAVAVALNDIPFIRNHFFEQEFFDVNQVEVVRGPQGTLYGRNATAGVVNVISAKPTDQFEAMLSADWGNYLNRRYEGMINIPVVDDWLDIRVAGEWTKRDGYTINENTGNPVDGRDLWSSRVTIGWHPISTVQTYLVWEHFSEDDDRMRTQKQLCETDNPENHLSQTGVSLTNIMGASVVEGNPHGDAFAITTGSFSQGCLPASMYSPKSFEVPYGYALPLVVAGYYAGTIRGGVDPYAETTQSRNLRVIQTLNDPHYDAKNDTLEFNADYNVTPVLTFTSQTGYNNDYLWSTEDYDRFNTTPGIFQKATDNDFPSTQRDYTLMSPFSDCSERPPNYYSSPPDGTWYFGDPQLGCSNRLVAQDISTERAWQFSQEFRLASNFKGPFNFSVGGNYMHYETVEDYYVFANTLTQFAATSDAAESAWMPGVTDNSDCLEGDAFGVHSGGDGKQYNDPTKGAGQPTSVCYYIDPNPLSSINGQGHNYFRSENPYVLNSYAGFGEAYYNVRPDLKLTGGIRWTDDQKHFIDIPSELLANGYGYAPIAEIDQQWNQLTGRFAADWTPKLDFTDQTLIYGSWAHGYKAGGANPPGAAIYAYASTGSGIPVHPLTFKPEFVDAYELGSKNTLLDGGLTLNGDVFYYNYSGYQISEIVDRTSINLNFNATVKGAELEAMYEPLPGLKFNFAGGYEDTHIDNGQSAVDLMDRTAGHPGWMLFRPFVTEPSNCIFPTYVIAALVVGYAGSGEGNPAVSACEIAYGTGYDPITNAPYKANPVFNVDYGQSTINGGAVNNVPDYLGYNPIDPVIAQETNNGAGFSKNLGGNQLPNAPHFTVSLSGEYTLPVSEDWAATFHSDFYWQSQSFARVFNDRPYDKIRGYSNVNLALILTSASGWQVMGYLKNVFDTTAITGTFLNSDDSGLTTNVFLTDPRLYGLRVTKNW